MQHTTQRVSRKLSAQSDKARRETSIADQVGRIQTRAAIRQASFVLPFVLTLAAAGLMYYFRLSIVLNIWTAVTSSAVASILLAIVLTVGVCGSLACAAIWWNCQREMRANARQRAELKQHLAMHLKHQANGPHRDAA